MIVIRPALPWSVPSIHGTYFASRCYCSKDGSRDGRISRIMLRCVLRTTRKDVGLRTCVVCWACRAAGLRESLDPPATTRASARPS